jgi:hypothetical protein
MVRILAGSLLALLLASQPATSGEHAVVDRAAPVFTLSSSDGKTHSLSDFEGKFVVLEWVNFGCPFVRKHYDSGNMQQLQKTYTAKGVIWLSVCSSAPGKQGYYAGEELTKQIARENYAGSAYLMDAEGTVGMSYGAKTTPHMFVIDPKGTLIYAGGIDDKPSTNREDIAGATNYVSQALDAALAGKTVATKESRSYGCSVKYK